jgi:uncharacterized membrane protein (UPF0127 family)
MESSSPRKKRIIAIILVIALGIFFFYVTHFSVKKPGTVEIQVASSTIYAQVANTENKRSLGLSYTPKIDENAGMLFVFDNQEARNFWMRDMYFDLDIIWLDENKQVVGFFERVPKESYNHEHPEKSKIYHSPDNTKYVLEVNSGTIQRLKINVGEKLEFNY